MYGCEGLLNMYVLLMNVVPHSTMNTNGVTEN